MPVPALERFEKFFEATSDCQFYVKKDADGRFRYVHVNPAALSVAGKAAEEEIIGLTPSEALGEEYGSTVEKNVLQAFLSGQTYHFRGSLGSDRGAPIYDALYLPLKDEEGMVAGVLGSARDISELNMLTERAIHAEKLEALGTIAGGVVHDLRNVIATFQSLINLLEDGSVSAERRAVLLRESRQTLANGKTLTERLSIFARRDLIKAVPHNIAHLLLESRSIVQRILGPAIEFSLECEDNLWSACCDRSEFEIALINLATNSRDAIGGSGCVTLSATNFLRGDADPATVPKQAVKVTFRDDGCGMDDATVSKAADPFFTTKPDGKGTGLGLSGIANFAKAIKGALEVESELGVGTAISIFLPKAED